MGKNQKTFEQKLMEIDKKMQLKDKYISRFEMELCGYQ